MVPMVVHMALAMARPWKHPKTGIYWLRQRVPDDLRPLLGKREEKRSLGTRDCAEVKRLHAQALIELEQRWTNLRAPQTRSGNGKPTNWPHLPMNGGSISTRTILAGRRSEGRSFSTSFGHGRTVQSTCPCQANVGRWLFQQARFSHRQTRHRCKATASLAPRLSGNPEPHRGVRFPTGENLDSGF